MDGPGPGRPHARLARHRAIGSRCIAREWFDQGRISLCSGPLQPLPDDIGQPVQVTARFDDQAALVRSWANGTQGMGMVVHLVDPAASHRGQQTAQ